LQNTTAAGELRRFVSIDHGGLQRRGGMNTGPEHHLIVTSILFFIVCTLCIRKKRFFLPILILLPMLMEFVQPLLPLNFSFEVMDIFWNYLGAAIGISLYTLFNHKIIPGLR
jgi:hypothetical protein